MPNVPGKLMIDIMNEPDAYNIRVRLAFCFVCFFCFQRQGRGETRNEKKKERKKLTRLFQKKKISL